MIDKEKIINYIKEQKPYFEPDILDFKKAEDISSSFLETVSAFANTKGGDIILGIHQATDGYLNYIGINEAQSYESKVRDFLRQKMTNLYELNYEISIENFNDYKLPLIFVYINKVEDINFLPVYITERGEDGGSFIRIGQRDEKMPKYMIDKCRKDKMIKNGELPSPEEQPVKDSSIKDLNIEFVKEYANLLKIDIQTNNLNETNLINFLETKKILQDGKITKFGLLAFSDNPDKYLHYLSSIQVSDERNIDLLIGERGKNKELFEGNLRQTIKKTLEWLNQNLAKERLISKEGITEEETIIHSSVLREIVVNAFCHRDYDANEKIFLKIKNDNQISIQNPGIINNEIYKDGFIMPGYTKHPNPLIAKYLFRYLRAEGEGKGFSTLLKACLSRMTDIPKIEVDFNGRVTVELSNNKLINKEIEIWLAAKKYYISIHLNDYDKAILAYLCKASDLIKKGFFAINLSEEFLNSQQIISLEKLKTNDLIREELCGSTKIFKLNKELLKNDFTNELLELFGDESINLDAQSIQILSFGMMFERNKVPFSASKIANLLYPNTPEEKLSDDIKRKVRLKCNSLEKDNFLIRDKNVKISSPTGSYRINMFRQIEKTKKNEELLKRGKEINRLNKLPL
ncbi:MAG: putative DNA binding domain-containing protein [Patescibacteria group bacterium]|nr:putative DNA binding domain-containing protein [Patescibacteria group bacterium]